MELNKELLLKIAKNARLELTKEEINEFLPQLKAILNSFDKLKGIEADEEPSFHPIKIEDVYREDKKEDPLTQDEALSNVKVKKEGYVKGPRVVE